MQSRIPHDAYDLTVHELHTYFVSFGEREVLVHNTECDDPIHGLFRGATREVDVDYTVRNGDTYVQEDGRRVYVVPNGDGSFAAAILDGALPTDPLVTVLESVNNSSLEKRISDGRWTPLGDF